MADWWKSLRFRQLFVLLLLGMLLLPLVESHAILSLVFQFIFLNALLVAMSAVHGRQVKLRVLVLGLWGVGTLLKVVYVLGSRPDLQQFMLMITAAVDVVIIGVCVVTVLRYVLGAREVDAERIFAAMVAYFLVAIMFTGLYDLIMTVAPGSFTVADGSSMQMHQELLYFSFVTITTLGYGDIVPHLPLVRSLAVIEAVVGQFYIAVVIAWLVSSYAGSRRN